MKQYHWFSLSFVCAAITRGLLEATFLFSLFAERDATLSTSSRSCKTMTKMLCFRSILLLHVVTTGLAFSCAAPSRPATSSLSMSSDWGSFEALDEDEDIALDRNSYAKEEDTQEMKAQVGMERKAPTIEFDAEPIFVTQGMETNQLSIIVLSCFFYSMRDMLFCIVVQQYATHGLLYETSYYNYITQHNTALTYILFINYRHDSRFKRRKCLGITSRMPRRNWYHVRVHGRESWRRHYRRCRLCRYGWSVHHTQIEGSLLARTYHSLESSGVVSPRTDSRNCRCAH